MPQAFSCQGEKGVVADFSIFFYISLDFVSEISENTRMQLSDTQMTFIRRWGDMGSRWGIPRSTAMLHGLLYLAPEPLTAEQMCELLQLARSNVSTGLRELESYNLIYRESRAGDRRSFYRAECDVWEMARRILEERRRRETGGAVSAVQDCLKAAQEQGDAHTADRMQAMSELLQTAENVALAAQRYPTSVFRRAALMGSKVLAIIAKL